LDAQDAENEFAWPFDTLIAWSSSPKSFLKTSRRQIMRSQGHSPT
jgi:hypothetical protein